MNRHLVCAGTSKMFFLPITKCTYLCNLFFLKINKNISFLCKASSNSHFSPLSLIKCSSPVLDCALDTCSVTFPEQICTLLLCDINSIFPPHSLNKIPFLFFIILFEMRRAFSCPLALIMQRLSEPLFISVVQQDCSKKEFKGSLIISSVLVPVTDRQLIF